MRYRLSENLNIPPKQERPQTDQISKNDYAKIKANIIQTRHALEEAEKKFKTLIFNKRRAEVSKRQKGMTEEPLTIDDLIQQAKTDLATAKSIQKTQIEDKTKNDKSIEENLQKRVAETREWYKKRRTLVNAGPKFLKHAYSPFGNILLVSSLTEYAFAIFTSRSYVEIWMKNGDQLDLVEAFEIPGLGLSSATELYHQETSREMDYLIDIFDQGNYLVGIKEQLAYKPKAPPPELSYGIFEPPSKSRILLTVDQMNKIASSRLQVKSNTRAMIDWETYPFDDYPIVTYRHVYFLGSDGGDGYIFEILTDYNPVAKTTEFRCQIRKREKLSYSPIKKAFFYYLLDGLPIIVMEVTLKSGENLVQGFKLSLFPEWTCKVDMMKLSIADKCTRYVNKDQIISLDETDSVRVPEEPLISSYAYDDVHLCLLMATNTGAVLRFFYQRDSRVSKAHRESVRSPDGPSTFDASEAALPGKVMWCLETPSLNQITNVVSKSISMDYLKDIPDEKQSEEGVVLLPKITSIREITHPIKKTSSIILSTSDGVVRMYPNDNLRCTPKPMVFYADRFLRGEMTVQKGSKFQPILGDIKVYCTIDYLCTSDGIQYIVGITSNSILFVNQDSLIIYDPFESSSVYLEVQILSFAIASGEISLKGAKTHHKHTYSVRVLDTETGLCVVYHGKHWSVLSLEETINWRRNDLIK